MRKDLIKHAFYYQFIEKNSVSKKENKKRECARCKTRVEIQKKYAKIQKQFY